MSWPASILSAILTAALGMFASGFVAMLAVDWYHISSREGASGYFAVAIGLLGFIAGLLIGLIVARTGAVAHPGFFRGTGISFAVVAGLAAVSGGLARALADVPPTLDHEQLLLEVEVRWPPGRTLAPAAVGPDEASLSLHSIPHFSHAVRVSESGPLWMEDAHLVEGRWVVPGAVEVFTSRGTRMLSVTTGEKETQGFSLPLGAFPSRKDLEWTGWLPDFRPGVKIPPNLLSFRYRVRKISQPIRTETIGPFEIATVASGFFDEQQGQRTLRAAYATYQLSHQGRPLAIDGQSGPSGAPAEPLERIDEVALLDGSRPAFLIHGESDDGSGSYYLIAAQAEGVRIEFVTQGVGGMKGQALTSNNDLFHAEAGRDPVRGRIDRTTYQRPGLYRIGSAVIDTRTVAFRRYTPDTNAYDDTSVPPLSLSPDEHSFVTLAIRSGEPAPLLLITDIVADRTYTLPVDPLRMRYPKVESIDPAWLEHHFEWRRGPDGADRLAERRHFVPLPWHGEISVDRDGHATYTLLKSTEALRGALVDFLVAEFKAERVPADSGAFDTPVTIDGRKVSVEYSASGGTSYIWVSTDRGAEDPALVKAIGQRFDAALATGKYDGLFGT